MHKGSAQIMVAVDIRRSVSVIMIVMGMIVSMIFIVRMRMIVSVSMVMIVIVTQQIRAEQVDAQTDRRNGNSLVECNGHRIGAGNDRRFSRASFHWFQSRLIFLCRTQAGHR
jgi:hypothetical protein